MYAPRREDDREVLDAVSRPAVISKKIYADIEQLARHNPGLSRQDVFRRYAQESGRALGAVSANYYREARRRREDENKAKSAVPSTAAEGLNELDALARTLTENIQRLVTLVAQQHRSLAEERERIEQAKRAILDA
jgi:hypothetical protein